MRKYLFLSKTALLNQSAYTARLAMFLLQDGIMLAIFIFIWRAVYMEGNATQAMPFNVLVTYYAIVFAFRRFTNSKEISSKLSSDVLKGELAGYLLKPIDYGTYIFFGGLTVMAVNALVPILMVTTLTFFIPIDPIN